MPHNIVKTAREAGTFQTLLTAVHAAGLGETLADGGPFTVSRRPTTPSQRSRREPWRVSSTTRPHSPGC